MDFLVICMPFVCLGQEDDGEVKKDEFSEIYERLAKKHRNDLPDFKLRIWARMLVCPRKTSIIFLILPSVFSLSAPKLKKNNNNKNA